MFTNLIESSSHAQDLKRRGSFVLFTTVTYFLLFAIAGVVSIFAYDARLVDQNLEEIVMLSPADFPAPQAAPVIHNAAQPRGDRNDRGLTVRENPIATVNHPEIPRLVFRPSRTRIRQFLMYRLCSVTAIQILTGLVGPLASGMRMDQAPAEGKYRQSKSARRHLCRRWLRNQNRRSFIRTPC